MKSGSTGFKYASLDSALKNSTLKRGAYAGRPYYSYTTATLLLKKRGIMKILIVPGVYIALAVLLPELGICSVETSLEAVHLKLVNKILPALGAVALCFAAGSFFLGHPNARQHLWMAVLGAAVAFGSTSIIDFVRALVR